MKKILFLLFLGSLIMLSSNELHAQRGASSDENPLWFGAGLVSPNFRSNAFESIFSIGLSPMVGYRLFDQFSVGTRISLVYTIYTIKNAGAPNESIDPITWEVGAFARYRFTNSPIFAHVELSVENQAFANRDPFTGELVAGRAELGNTYIGGGYSNSGGGRWAYEFTVLYNVNQRDLLLESPVEFRLGFTYNF